MVESLPLIVPLISLASVAILDEGCVDWQNILLSADRLHEGFDGGEGVLVVQGNHQGEPSLSDFGVVHRGHIQISVDPLSYLVGHVIHTGQEKLVENNFQVHILCLVDVNIYV